MTLTTAALARILGGTVSTSLRRCPDADCGRLVDTFVNPDHCPACGTRWGGGEA